MRKGRLIVGSHEGLGWMDKVSLCWVVEALDAPDQEF